MPRRHVLGIGYLRWEEVDQKLRPLSRKFVVEINRQRRDRGRVGIRWDGEPLRNYLEVGTAPRAVLAISVSGRDDRPWSSAYTHTPRARPAKDGQPYHNSPQPIIRFP